MPNLVPTSKAVRRYNQLNAALAFEVPRIAVAADTLNRVVLMLREMQRLLSQRPHGGRTGFRRQRRKVLAEPAASLADLPTWGTWIGGFACEIGYTVRHLRRLILNKPRKKYVKECGGSAMDHNRLIVAASLSLDLVRALEAGADPVAIIAEIHRNLDERLHLLEKPWEAKRRKVRKRRPREFTDVA